MAHKPVQPEVHEPTDELQQLKDMLHRLGLPFLLALLVVVAVVWGVRRRRAQAELQRGQAFEALSAAQESTALENLISDHPDQPTAALALLRLAKGRFSEGDYDAAAEAYKRFATTYPDHPMVAAADLGKAHCMEAKGQTNQARTEFATFAEKNAGHFLVSQAILGEARCLEQLGLFDKARIVYEDFIATETNSSWTVVAEEYLGKLNSKLERQGVEPATEPSAEPTG